MKTVKVRGKEYELEEKDALLIEVLQLLTRAVEKLK